MILIIIIVFIVIIILVTWAVYTRKEADISPLLRDSPKTKISLDKITKDDFSSIEHGDCQGIRPYGGIDCRHHITLKKGNDQVYEGIITAHEIMGLYSLTNQHVPQHFTDQEKRHKELILFQEEMRKTQPSFHFD